MRKYDNEIISNAIRLRKEVRLSSLEIALKLNIPVNTIINWIKPFKLTNEEIRKRHSREVVLKKFIEMHICKNCSKRFEIEVCINRRGETIPFDKDKTGNFCSETCARSFAAKTLKGKTKIIYCKTCNKEFVIPINSGEKECNVCKDKKMKHCISCGKILKKTNKSGYCKECHRKDKRYRDKMREHAIRRNFGGHTSKYTVYYKKLNGDVVFLQSNYELTMAIDLDNNKIEWIRPKPLLWKDGKGLQHKYYADFYIPSLNVYLDTKNDYLIDLHREKVHLVRKQNNIGLLVLGKNQLTWQSVLNEKNNALFV